MILKLNKLVYKKKVKINVFGLIIHVKKNNVQKLQNILVIMNNVKFLVKIVLLMEWDV